MCLHRKAGSGVRLENSVTSYEKQRIKTGEKMVYSVAITLVKTTSQEWFIGPLDQEDALRPLTACTASSPDGKNTFNISVRGDKQNFPDTPSVCSDKAAKTATNAKTNERRRKRKADAISSTAT
jgi:hypothetical protein